MESTHQVTDSSLIKTNFVHLISMALQSKMSWKMLAEVFDGIIPSFEEAKQVINILLMELEKLQLKLMEKEGKVSPQNQELKMCRNVDSSEDTQTISLETETMSDELQSSVKETETMDDEIEVLEVVKESMMEKMYLNERENSKSFKKNVDENDGHDSGDKDSEDYMDEIDNEWYVFVKNGKTNDQLTESLVHDQEFPENEIKSSNESELEEQTTENNEYDIAIINADNSIREMDNKRDTLDRNDKNNDSEREKTVEGA